MNPQSLQTTLMEGRGRGGGVEKHFCDLVGVSLHRNGEIRSLIAFVSSSFVQDCILGVGNIYIYTLLDIGLWDILRIV